MSRPEFIRQAVEKFHLLFLHQLSQKLDKRLYALKGGCNLRFYFGSIRYSEDIDLDVQTIAPLTLRNKVNQILKAASFRSILSAHDIIMKHYTEPKQTETTQRWKFELAVPNSSLQINTRLEFSRREKTEAVLFEPVQQAIIQSYRLMPILLSHYSAMLAYQQKIRELAFRKQTQARDVFDLYILQGIEKINFSAVPADIISLFKQAQKHAMNITFADFKGQVLAFLPSQYRKQYDDPKIWDGIVLKVCEDLEAH